MRKFILSLGLVLLTSHALAFDRDLALSKYKDQCHPALAGAMGLSEGKLSGKSQTDLERIAAKSKEPELYGEIVSELFSVPELQPRTFIFYRFESCLISKADGSPVVALLSIRAPLKECEKHLGLGELIECIDSVIESNNGENS